MVKKKDLYFESLLTQVVCDVRMVLLILINAQNILVRYQFYQVKLYPFLKKRIINVSI